MSGRVTTLVIRDPDYENEYVEEVEGDIVTEMIDIDLGSEFNGPKDFDPEADWAQGWVEDVRERVSHLPINGPIRGRVEELIRFLESR